jgi:predicted transcriptional regulator
MSKSERAVLDVLFPEVRAKLLRSFFTTPPKQRYVRELVNVSGLTLHTVQDELRKLSAVGLLSSWSNGYHRFYRANRDHPMYPKLVGIVQLSETLPHAKSSALERPRGRRAPKAQARRQSRSLPPDRPASWHLFEQQGKTRRL